MKDETVVLTCELGDHTPAEEIIKVNEAAETTTDQASKKIAELKEYMSKFWLSMLISFILQMRCGMMM